MNTKHTPGPWILTGRYTVRSDSDHADVNRDLIAKIHWNNGEANARLIASAPELLRAAKQAWDVWHREMGEDADGEAMQAYERLGIAIDQAEGVGPWSLPTNPGT